MGHPVRQALRCHDCGMTYDHDVDALNVLRDHIGHDLVLVIEPMRPGDVLPREFRILDFIATRGEAMISDLEYLMGVLRATIKTDLEGEHGLIAQGAVVISVQGGPGSQGQRWYRLADCP